MRVVFFAAVLLLDCSQAQAAQPVSQSLLAKSKAAELAGNREAALRYAQAAIVADPAAPANYTALADLYMRAREPDAASFYYAEALSIDPQDETASEGLALADKESATSTAAAQSLDKNHDAP